MEKHVSVRLIVLDRQNRILLFDCEEEKSIEPARPDLLRFWITPGGRLEPGESFETAARRELWEETGLRDVTLGPCIWTRKKKVVLQGTPVLGVERYYLVYTPATKITFDNLLDYEQIVFRQYRWWTINELQASTETIFPEGLATLLQPILVGELPESPIDISP